MYPNVKRISKTGVETMDLYSYHFLVDREIRLEGEINSAVAGEICSQLEYLDRNGEGEIILYINSPGGSVVDGRAIIDCIKMCRNPVATVCMGLAASMGAVLLAAGEPGRRFLSPGSEVMIHQPLGGTQGQASDVELMARHLLHTKENLTMLLAKLSGRSEEEIRRDCDRNYYMSAQEAIDYGLADHLLKGWIV